MLYVPTKCIHIILLHHNCCAYFAEQASCLRYVCIWQVIYCPTMVSNGNQQAIWPWGVCGSHKMRKFTLVVSVDESAQERRRQTASQSSMHPLILQWNMIWHANELFVVHLSLPIPQKACQLVATEQLGLALLGDSWNSLTMLFVQPDPYIGSCPIRYHMHCAL